ncbi:MAG TPA: COX15/CtaA family protein [Verrucomicrobiota bacterium]|nr:COX15/CtaA family protein [Verrucomicrobiota bacterium]
MTTDPSHSPWLHRFVVLTAAATLFLLCVGGLVTSHGVGMAVPDWPTTYGYNMFFFPISKWTGGIFYEHTHRLVASVVGLLTAILAAWVWIKEARGRQRNLALAGILCTLGLMGVRTQTMFIVLASVAAVVLIYSFWKATHDPRPLRWLAAVAFTAVLVQGVLGGLRVTQYKDELGIFHGTLAQLFFVLICAIALFTSKWWNETGGVSRPTSEVHGESQTPAASVSSAASRSVRRLFLLSTVLIFFQLIIGATMRHEHAGLAIPDFPLAYGKLWPDLDPQSIETYNARRIEITAVRPIQATHIVIQMAHRLMALLIVVCVVLVAWNAKREVDPVLKRLSRFWLGMILVQAGFGAWTIWSNKAADIATAHVLVGALSLVTGALGCIICFRRLKVPVGVARASDQSSKSGAGAFGVNSATALNP